MTTQPHAHHQRHPSAKHIKPAAEKEGANPPPRHGGKATEITTMPPTLATTWAINAAAGQAPSVVRVRNLQSTTHIGLDGWTRARRPQPLLVSAAVSLARPSDSSSSADRVAADTVHYGLLSKAILSVLDAADSHAKNQEGPDATSLRRLLDEIWARLTDRRLDGSVVSGRPDPFLDLRAVSCLSVTLHLPKASLIGGGVSLTGTSLYEAGEPRMYGACLGLSDMRVPTLIGVNDNERRANQVVIADVEIDCFEEGDVYPQIGQAIYKVCSIIPSLYRLTLRIRVQ